MITKLVREKGKLAISVDGRVIHDLSFKSFRPTRNNVSDFFEAGVRLFHVYCSGLMSGTGIPYSLYGETWFAEGVYNFESLDRQFEMFLASAPGEDAYFILNIHIDSREWWHDENPGRNHSFTHLSQISADEKWRKDTAEYLKACIRHCEEKYGDKIVAYYLLGGYTTEWFSDFDYEESHPIKLAAFRAHLGDENATIPAKEELEKPISQLFLDPDTDKQVIAYRRFHNELIVDTVLYYAKAAQEVLDHNKLVGVFFGYILELRGARLWNAGHLEYDKLYASEDIDLLATPSSYQYRAYDAPSACMLLSDTLDLHDKMYFISFDHMNYNVKKLMGNPRRLTDDGDLEVALSKLTGTFQRNDFFEDAKHTIDAMQREFMMRTSRRVGMWWFDMFEGWYYDDDLMAGIKSIVDTSKSVNEKEVTSGAEIAVFVSSDSMYYVNKCSLANVFFINDQRMGLAYIGAPYDIFSTADLTKIDSKKYKMFVFLNAFSLTKENRDHINHVLKKDGKAIVFAGPCDFIDDDGVSVERMENMLGMKLELMEIAEKQISYNDITFGHTIHYQPMFSVKEDSGERVASFVESGKIGVAVKKEKDYSVYYSALGNLHASLFHSIAKEAGVHIYTDCGIATFVNSTFFGIYNTKADETVISLLEDGEYTEIFSGKKYTTVDKKITLPTKDQPAQMLVKNEK